MNLGKTTPSGNIDTIPAFSLDSTAPKVSGAMPEIELLIGDDGHLVAVEELNELEQFTTVSMENLEAELAPSVTAGGGKHLGKHHPCIEPPDDGCTLWPAGDRVVVHLAGSCVRAYTYLIHYLRGDSEWPVILVLNTPRMSSYDTLALADAIACSKTTVMVVVATISTIADLILISEADSVECGSMQQILPPRDFFVVGSGTQAETSITGKNKYMDILFDKLRETNMLDDSQISDLKVSTSAILVSPSRLTK